VYLASAAPPVRYPNIYGIDMPTNEELVAHNRSIDEIRQQVGADALIYQNLDAMKAAVAALNPQVTTFEASCFDACYITGDKATGPLPAAPVQTRLALEAQDSEFADFENRLNLPNGS
jgi:amidophosphoribosyltransferase